MFCHQCGAELTEEMQFCPFCGAKRSAAVPASKSQPKPKKRKKADPTVTLPLLGETVSYDGSIALYLHLRQVFDAPAGECAGEFAEHFYDNYRDMDTLIRNFPDDLTALLQTGLDTLNGVLAQQQIFGVTDDELDPLLRKYCLHAYSAWQEIEEAYQAIVGRQEDLREYRQVRKEGRGRVVGGGFGLEGAAKGMMAAGAVNMATGALHSVGNAIGNLGSAISAASAKDKLLRSGIADALRDGIEQDLLGLHLTAAELISGRTGKRICMFTEADMARADKIQADLEQGSIPAMQRRAAVVRMLAAYPLTPRYYRTATALFPERADELREFAAYFGFDSDAFYRETLALLDPAAAILLEYRDELDDLLSDDLEHEADETERLPADTDGILAYFADVFQRMGESGCFFFPDQESRGRAKLQNARDAYASYGSERPLLLYDSTLTRSGKSGFLVTDRHVYAKGTGRAAVFSLSAAIEDVHQAEDPSNHCIYLYFGEYGVHLLQSGSLVEEEVFGNLMECILSAVLFLTVRRPTEGTLWDAVAQYCRLPHPEEPSPEEAPALPEETAPAEVQYCFECGAENEPGDRYCCECGAELL